MTDQVTVFYDGERELAERYLAAEDGNWNGEIPSGVAPGQIGFILNGIVEEYSERYGVQDAQTTNNLYMKFGEEMWYFDGIDDPTLDQVTRDAMVEMRERYYQSHNHLAMVWLKNRYPELYERTKVAVEGWRRVRGLGEKDDTEIARSVVLGMNTQVWLNRCLGVLAEYEAKTGYNVLELCR